MSSLNQATSQIGNALESEGNEGSKSPVNRENASYSAQESSPQHHQAFSHPNEYPPASLPPPNPHSTRTPQPRGPPPTPYQNNDIAGPPNLTRDPNMQIFQPTPPRENQPLESQSENAAGNTNQEVEESTLSEPMHSVFDHSHQEVMTVENASSSEEADDYVEIESAEQDDGFAEDESQDTQPKETLKDDQSMEVWYWERTKRSVQIDTVDETEDSENVHPSIEASSPKVTETEKPSHAMVHAVDTVSETTDAPLSAELAVVPENTVQALALASPSRFRFYMDEQHVPTELSEMETRTLQRRREFDTSVHDLECKVAQLMARLAHERMDREKVMHNTQRDTVLEPVEQVLEQLSYIRDAQNAADDKPTWMSLERRLTQLDSNFTYCVHVGLQDAKRAQLDSLHDQLAHDLTSELKLEAFKADKREGGMVRRFEGMVGTMARRIQEESAARVAAVEMASKQLKEISEIDVRRGDGFLTTIQQLRAQIKQERMQRQAQDRIILDRIVQTTATMKRAVLETFRDPDMVDDQPRLLE